MLRFFEGTEQTANYLKYGYQYPDGVAKTIVDYANRRKGVAMNEKLDLVVDVGCGPGVSTKIFHDRAKKIIGIDPSENQIKQAKHGNARDDIQYMIGQAEDLPFEDNTVDLICGGMIGHYLDLEAFYTECRRVLKPDGSLSLFGFKGHLLCRGYEGRTPDPEALQVLAKFTESCIFHDDNRNVRNKYSDIFDSIPCGDKTRNDEFVIHTDFSLKEFLLYMSVWSGYQTYLLQNNGERVDIIKRFENELKAVWKMEKIDNKDIAIHVMADVFILLSGRPQAV